jgi:hypothetical protein
VGWGARDTHEEPDVSLGEYGDAGSFDGRPERDWSGWSASGTPKPSNYGVLVRSLERLSGKAPKECRNCFCLFDYDFDMALTALRAS